MPGKSERSNLLGNRAEPGMVNEPVARNHMALAGAGHPQPCVQSRPLFCWECFVRMLRVWSRVRVLVNVRTSPLNPPRTERRAKGTEIADTAGHLDPDCRSRLVGSLADVRLEFKPTEIRWSGQSSWKRHMSNSACNVENFRLCMTRVSECVARYDLFRAVAVVALLAVDAVVVDPMPSVSFWRGGAPKLLSRRPAR
jgi:hypothetical protein